MDACTTKWTRRHLLEAGTAAAILPGLGRKAFALDADDPASLHRAGGKSIALRAWERYPAPDVTGLARYLDGHKDLSVEWSSAPFARYRDRMIAEFIADTPLDIVEIPETELAAWADSGWLEPLDGRAGLAEVLSASTPAAREGTKGRDGKTYALPYLGDAFGFAYDKSVLEKAGFGKPGKNLDELRRQMIAVKQAGLDEAPLSLGLKRQPGQFFGLWATLYASGGELFAENGEPVFERKDNPLAAILDWCVAAMNDWKIVGPDDLQRDWGVARTAMRSGTVKFSYMAQYALSELNLTPDAASAGKIHMALVPGLDRNDIGTVGYAHSVGLASSSKHKDDAWKMLLYFAGKDDDGQWYMPRIRALDQGGRCPIVAVYETPELQQMIRKETVGDMDDFLTLSKISRQKRGIKTTWYPEWELYLMSQVQDALLKKTSVAAAIAASAKEARRLAKA